MMYLCLEIGIDSEILLEYKIFKKEDILKLSKELFADYKKDKSDESYFRIILNCDYDNSTYEINNSDFGSKEELLDIKKINNIKIEFDDYKKKNHVSINLREGDKDYSYMEINGSDEKWIDHKYQKINDIIGSVEPQSNLFLKYGKIIYHFSSINIGFLFWEIYAWLYYYFGGKPYSTTPASGLTLQMTIEKIPILG